MTGSPLARLLTIPALTLALASGAAAQEEVTVAHAYSNFGEVKYGPDALHLDYVNPDAPKGGEISLAALGNYDSFNPYTRKGVAGALASILYENILVSTADDPYGLYCHMCTTMEYPESLSWVIFNLRNDITFWDGTNATAEDIKFTYDTLMEQGITEFTNLAQSFFEDVEVLDTYRIKFSFKEGAPRRDRIAWAALFGPFSKKWFEETGARIDESTLVPFMATGPYKLGSYDVGRQIIYERNPNYWAAEHPLAIGTSNFDRIRVEYYADSSAAFEGFKAGQYTFRIDNNSKIWATGYDFPALNNGWIVKEELPDGTIGTGQSWVFNLRREQWQDPRTREAVRMMFNFEFSNDVLFYGLYERVNSFWENSDLEAIGAPSEGELALLQPLVDEGLLDAAILQDDAVMAPVNEADENLPNRRIRRAASKLLEEAGWIINDDGWRYKDGERLTLTLLGTSPAFDRIVNPFVENLRDIGIDAKNDRVDIAQAVERERSSDYDLTSQSFTMSFEPGLGLKQWFGSETAEDSSRNLMALQSPAVDRLIDAVTASSELEELKPAVRALDRVLRSEGFWVQQWFKDVHTVAYYDMYRYPEPLPPLSLGYLDFWWYDAEAGERLRAAGALN